MSFPPATRKLSDRVLYPERRTKPAIYNSDRLKVSLLVTITIAALYVFVLRPHSRQSVALSDGLRTTASGSSTVLLVTALAPSLSPSLRQMIKDNRRLYASKHGYKVFFPKSSSYNMSVPTSPSTAKSPPSWVKVPAMRHAMTLFPQATYYWYLDWTVFVMNTSLSLEKHVMSPVRLESIMLVDHPVIPPDGIIRTLAHRKSGHVDLVLTHDHEGLSPSSFIIRRGEWASYFLDSWFDPLYREYEFQRVERHALEHLIQWHSTVLSRLALVPQRMMNSYFRGNDDEKYKEGDFVANLYGCEEAADRNCDAEAEELEHRLESGEVVS